MSGHAESVRSLKNVREMVKYILSAFLLVQAVFLFAQNSIVILNVQDNAPVEDAYVVFQEISGAGEKKRKSSSLSGKEGVVKVPFNSVLFVHITLLGFIEVKDTLPAGTSKTYFLQPLSFPLQDVVVTAQFTPEDPRSTVFPVKVLQRENIERQAANNLRELLVFQANTRIAQDNVLGSSINMQGLGGEQIKIMIDGVPVIGRMGGNIDISQLNLNNVQRIEIIEGPVSVQYGTNALGGAINIITDKQKQQDGFKASLNGYSESVGVYNADGGLGFVKNKSKIDVTGGRYFFDGYSETDTMRFKDWKPKEQYFGTLKYGYGFKRLNFTLKGDAFYEKITNRGIPRPPYNITAFDDYYHTQRYIGAATLNGEILENHYIDQVVSWSYYSRAKNTFYKDLVTLENTQTANPDDQDTTRFNAFLARGFISRNKPGKIFNYQVGYDINVETGSGDRMEEGSQMIGDYALFTSFKIVPVKELALQAGVRWSYNTNYHPPVTPSLHLRWTPIKEVVVRASYARGFRAPSLKEMYLYFVDINHNIKGNTELKAESSNNVNFSLDYIRQSGKHRVAFMPSFFFNDIHDLITLAQTGIGNEFTYVNIAEYRTLGGEMRIGYRYRDLNVEVSGAATGRRNIGNEDYFFSPEVAVQAGYTIPKALVTVSLFNKFNGRLQMFFIDETGSLREQGMDAFNIMDFTLLRKFWNDRLTLTTGVKNIFDVNNINTTGAGGIHSGSANSSPIAWGRSYFASLKILIEKRKSA